MKHFALKRTVSLIKNFIHEYILQKYQKKRNLKNVKVSEGENLEDHAHFQESGEGAEGVGITAAVAADEAA